MAEEKMRAVFNKGDRTYHTSVGELLPKQSVTVPEEEAKMLLEYFDIADLDKVAPKASAQLRDLKAENDKLKADLAAAQESKKEESKPVDDDVLEDEEKPSQAKEAEHKKPAHSSGKGGKKGKK